MKKTIVSLFLISNTFLFAQEVNTQQQENTNVEVSVLAPQEKFLTTSLTAKEAFEKLQLNNEILLIDVRSPQKVYLSGFPINTNIFISKENFNDKTYNFEENKYFFDELKYELSNKNIAFDREIMIIDDYNDRFTKNIASSLNELGYKQIYTISDGFEGSKARYGKFKGQRVVDGWKNRTSDWEINKQNIKFWNSCKYNFLFEPEDKTKCENN